MLDISSKTHFRGGVTIARLRLFAVLSLIAVLCVLGKQVFDLAQSGWRSDVEGGANLVLKGILVTICAAWLRSLYASRRKAFIWTIGVFLIPALFGAISSVMILFGEEDILFKIWLSICAAAATVVSAIVAWRMIPKMKAALSELVPKNGIDESTS